jgi:hypothetical protein
MSKIYCQNCGHDIESHGIGIPSRNDLGFCEICHECKAEKEKKGKEYKENPKTKGSGIMCAIPQSDPNCPNNCKDCFYQSGRSYLEPLKENLPNMPTFEESWGHIMRINDGHDSYFLTEKQIHSISERYANYFFNTSISKDLGKYQNNFGQLIPVVITINPGQMTDVDFHKIDKPTKNLMFVRFRANYWNEQLAEEAVKYYSQREVPIIFTWMAYHELNEIPTEYRSFYLYRKRTLNSYYAISTQAWRYCMRGRGFDDNKWVYSCGKIEGEEGDTHCRFCGNCLREYYACMERIKGG